MDKFVIMVCGAGFATSTAGERAVQAAAKEVGVKVKTAKRRAVELPTVLKTQHPDFYLLMTPTNLELNAPSINGVPLISGVGKAEVMEQIKAELSK